MRRLAIAVVAVVAMAAAGVAAWRRNRRMGSARMNQWINPFIVRLIARRGLAGGGGGEFGVIEHIGRRSGTRRLTPVRVVATDDGYRIMVPLGLESEWARNVLAAGHCRMQVAGTVYELDEPRLLVPGAMAELPAIGRAITGWLGFRYLRLRTFAQHPGNLAEAEAEAQAPGIAEPASAEAPLAEPEPEPVTPG